MRDRVVAVYADGGLFASNPSRFGGCGAWIHVSEPDPFAYNESGMSELRSSIVTGGVALVQNSRVADVDHVRENCLLEKERFTGRYVKGESVSNNIVELIAVIAALLSLPVGWEGKVYTDSQVTIGRMRDGWKMVGVPDDIREEMEFCKETISPKVEYVLLNGHPTKEQLKSKVGSRGLPASMFNVYCDTRAKVFNTTYFGKEPIDKYLARIGCQR